MALRKSTWIWLGLFLLAVVALSIDGETNALGSFAIPFVLLAWLSGSILLWRGGRQLFRLIVHRLTLRLAFSYFLIGIVPIPLLAALFIAFGYLLCHQLIATGLRTEVNNLAELVRASGDSVPRVRIDRDGRVLSSDVPWLSPGDSAAWVDKLAEPHPILAAGRVWIAIRSRDADGALVRLLPVDDPSARWLQRLADRTGHEVAVRPATGQRSRSGFQLRVGERRRTSAEPLFVRPLNAPEPSAGFWNRQWLTGIYLDRAVARFGGDSERTLVAFIARTSPAVLASQLFAQGVPEVTRVVTRVLMALAAALLFVYLVALAIAFVLVGSIVRNVNRLTRATRAISKGDFSVRVNSRSRDQIGDLARSFDGMAASIQTLLQETKRKEKLEADLAVARAIQESFLPESGASWKGFQAVAHFEPSADLGGDYYDILPMPDGRTAVSIGDVSGHGLPTGLVAAGARASLASFVEVGLPAGEAFLRLAGRSQRSHGSNRRLYTTLCFFAYDAERRIATLTNAGHPAPYRVSQGRVERLDLPALPIGLFPGRPTSYASKDFSFSPSDRVVLFTDGIVEAADAQEEPWGYERLEALLAREGHRPAEELVAAILAAVAAHVGDTPLEDDRTLLVLTLGAD